MNPFKPGTLAARWRKNHDGDGPDVVIFYPNKPDGHMLHNMLCDGRRQWDGSHGPSLVDELDARGYDLTTLQFTVRKKPKP